MVYLCATIHNEDHDDDDDNDDDDGWYGVDIYYILSYIR